MKKTRKKGLKPPLKRLKRRMTNSQKAIAGGGLLLFLGGCYAYYKDFKYISLTCWILGTAMLSQMGFEFDSIAPFFIRMGGISALLTTLVSVTNWSFAGDVDDFQRTKDMGNYRNDYYDNRMFDFRGQYK